MAVYQYRPEWSGTTGGSGVSVLTARLGAAADLEQFVQYFADSVRAFYGAVTARLPNEVSISFPGEVQAFDTVTGQLTAVHPVTAPANTAGTATGGYAHASGARIDWTTESIVNGRRLRGRTYMVPCAASDFGADGRLGSTAINAWTTAANTLISNMNLQGSLAVWSRTHGLLADVSGVRIPALGAVLRSRRD